MQDEYAENRAGERLRASIEGRGKSLAAFARHADIPYRSLQDYVAGKSRPGFEQLARLARAGLDVGYILTGHATGALEPHVPPSISFGDDFSMGSHPYRDDDTLSLVSRVDKGFGLRDWIDIWNLADAHVVDASRFGLEERRRQAAVALVACGIAHEVVARLKSLGWIES